MYILYFYILSIKLIKRIFICKISYKLNLGCTVSECISAEIAEDKTGDESANRIVGGVVKDLRTRNVPGTPRYLVICTLAHFGFAAVVM